MRPFVSPSLAIHSEEEEEDYPCCMVQSPNLDARPHCSMHQARWLYRVAQYTLTSAVDETPCDADSPWPNRRVVTYPQLTARP